MNQASLYQRANNVQRRDAKQVLQEYANIIQWRKDGRDRLLDVGSGSGNVLMDFVYPLLPENFEQLVGSDISAKMMDYATKHYHSHQRTKFAVLDISREDFSSDFTEYFDHVTSFYCLHWVQNQKRALQNIYKVLRREGGDCLFVFLAGNPIFDVYKALSKTTKWGQYMQDVDQFISPLHYSEDPAKEFCKLLSEAGFVDYNVEIRNEIYVYEGVQSLKDNVQAVCPFLDRIPEDDHVEFMNDIINIVINMNLREEDTKAADFKFISPYKLVVAYAKKSEGFLNNVLDVERER